VIQVSNLSCARNEQALFNNLSFNVKAGHALQIVGNNGVGKSTLLKILAGLLQPEAGAIKFAEAEINYIGHAHNLHPDLTVAQNLQFILKLAENQTDIAECLMHLQMQHKAKVACRELSAGQLQRVSLSRLVGCANKIWLLDEPLANLDQAGCALFTALCVAHLNVGGAIIVATHKLMELSAHICNILELGDHGYNMRMPG
jgi:heme exporter protein A